MIIDQADYLSRDALDLLRTLYDDLRMGLVLIGLPRLKDVLKGRSSESRQLASRIATPYEFTNPTFEHVENILDDNWHGLSYELKNLFYKYSGGSLRILSHLIYHCKL